MEIRKNSVQQGNSGMEIAVRHGIKVYESAETVKQEPCECPARKALEEMLRLTELLRPPDSHVGPCGPESGCDGGCAELAAISDTVWRARAALSTPCPCEQLREETARLLVVAGELRRIQTECEWLKQRFRIETEELRKRAELAEAERDRLRTERDEQYLRAQSLQDSLLTEICRVDKAVAECSQLQDSFRAAAAQSERSRQFSIAAQRSNQIGRR